MENFEIRVGMHADLDTERNVLCFYQQEPLGSSETVMFSCARPLRGTHVSISKRGYMEALTLCEVEVYGTGKISCNNITLVSGKFFISSKVFRIHVYGSDRSPFYSHIVLTR